MEITKAELNDKLSHLNMLLKRINMPHIPHEGPRGRSQERALTQISLREGITQRELMERLGIQPSSASELLSKLENGGMIERRTNEDDKRQVNLYLKDSGRDYLERINGTQERPSPFDELSENELSTLDTLIVKLIGAAEKICIDKGLPVYPLPFNGMHPPRPDFSEDGRPPFSGRPPFGGPGMPRHGRRPFAGAHTLPNIAPEDDVPLPRTLPSDGHIPRPVQLAGKDNGEKI
ncbi:MAG: MarR family transcriptional regulator [Clostridia bacterium]|nr:MarR family transcriptional regulator [Clostridia bacterium]